LTQSKLVRMHIVYLLLGGNLGDREKNLADAAKLVAERLGKILLLSSIYETAPWGYQSQPSFLNQVVKVETDLAPLNILNELKDIELFLGRKNTKKWHERLIDIDILMCDDMILNSKDLVIPHPHLHKRKFTLIPFAEIAAELVHPQLKKTIKKLSEECTDELKVEKYNETVVL